MNRIGFFFGLLALMFAVAMMVTWKAFTAGEDAAGEGELRDPVPAVETPSPNEEELQGKEGDENEAQ